MALHKYPSFQTIQCNWPIPIRAMMFKYVQCCGTCRWHCSSWTSINWFWDIIMKLEMDHYTYLNIMALIGIGQLHCIVWKEGYLCNAIVKFKVAHPFANIHWGCYRIQILLYCLKFYWNVIFRAHLTMIEGASVEEMWTNGDLFLRHVSVTRPRWLRMIYGSNFNAQLGIKSITVGFTMAVQMISL